MQLGSCCCTYYNGGGDAFGLRFGWHGVLGLGSLPYDLDDWDVLIPTQHCTALHMYPCTMYAY